MSKENLKLMMLSRLHAYVSRAIERLILGLIPASKLRLHTGIVDNNTPNLS